MTAMFKNNKKLKKLDVSVIDTSNVKDTSYMFNGCDELEVSEDDFTLDDTVVKDNMFPSLFTIVSGNINTVSSEICIGEECFYVISSDDEKVAMLAKYNLYVGGVYNSGWTAYGNEATGIQDSTMKGHVSGQSVSHGSTVFSKTNYWSSSVSSYPDYVYDSNSTIYSYVETYKSYLEGLGASIKEARLITYEELEGLGCRKSGFSCSNASSWVYATSYWSGSAGSAYTVWFVISDGNFNSSRYDNKFGYYGVRPVIEIAKSEF